ncbi:hypothetical protein FACS1894219_11370 [Clostridia bacterium]|nr:hypothetical protein FACS1894219_11370 [Clostridia bacterium]
MALTVCIGILASCVNEIDTTEDTIEETTENATETTSNDIIETLDLSENNTGRLWGMEKSLWEIANETVIHETFIESRPASGPMWKQSIAEQDTSNYQGVQINNTDMRVSLWGATDALTLSIRKSDVWDRRIFTDYTWPTLQSIVDASFLNVNKNRTNAPVRGMGGYPTESGTNWEDFGWNELPPVQKPVGQIILQMPEFKGLETPVVDISCANGSAKLSMTGNNGKAKADITYLTTMPDDKNIIAMKLDYTDITQPIALRLYRQNDNANAGIDDPVCSTDANGFFWIEQTLPAEATFPQGFTNYLVGYLTGSDYTLKKNTSGGANITAEIKPGSGTVQVYTTVVTSAELKTGKFNGDLLAAAINQLQTAADNGFGSLLSDNENWYRSFYNSRENGRIFTGDDETARQQIIEIFRSWVFAHAQTDNPDPLQYESDSWNSTGFGFEAGGWHGIPVWNEAYFSQFVVKNRTDQLTYYKNLAAMWLEKGKENAKSFGFENGWIMTHGYVPPIEPTALDEGVYPHVESSLEFSFDSAVFLVRPMWDIWDYAGDKNYLKDSVYPIISELAIFYSEYLEYCTEALKEKFPGDESYKDGNYHAIGTTSEQHGWTYKLERNIDPVGTLTACKWTFAKAIEGAKTLGYTDAKTTALIADWQYKLDHIAPYSTFTRKSDGSTVITDVRNLDPFQFPLDFDTGYNFFDGTAPVLRTDEINLDSTEAEKKLYYDTAMLVGEGDMHQSGWMNLAVPHLLGYDKDILHQSTPTRGWWIMEEPTLLSTPADLVQAAIEQPDRLINSRSGRIHLFSCVPDGSTIAFKNMLARGAFVVSSELVSGTVTYISLKSINGGEAVVVNPFGSDNLTVYDITADSVQTHTIAPHASGDGIVFDTEAGHKYEIRRNAIALSLENLIIGGKVFNGFNPDNLSYVYPLPLGATSQPSIETVSADGATVEITGDDNLNGTKIITVTDGDAKTIYTIRFTHREIASAKLAPRLLPYPSNIPAWENWIAGKSNILESELSKGLRVFDVPELITKAYTSDGERVFIDDYIVYESGNESVIKPLPNGNMIVVGNGSATVTSKIIVNGETITAGTITFTTNSVGDGDWSLNCSNTELLVGQSDNITLGNIEQYLTDIVYKSSDPNILEVDPKGIVTGRSIGNATVTVSITKRLNRRPETFTVSKKIDFNVTGSALLSAIYVDGKYLEDFSADKTGYTVMLNNDTNLSNLPELTYDLVDANASVEYTPASSFPGAATINVTPVNGKTNRIYTIIFDYTYVNSEVDKSNWKVDASNYWPTEAQYFDIRNKEIAIDGEQGEMYSSDEWQAVGMWYKIDMTDVHKINRFTINFTSGGYSPEFEVYTATDRKAWSSPIGGNPRGGNMWDSPGTIWTKVGEVHVTGDGLTEIEFPMIDARYIIFVITEPNTESHWHFNELTAYAMEETE